MAWALLAVAGPSDKYQDVQRGQLLSGTIGHRKDWDKALRTASTPYGLQTHVTSQCRSRRSSIHHLTMDHGWQSSSPIRSDREMMLRVSPSESDHQDPSGSSSLEDAYVSRGIRFDCLERQDSRMLSRALVRSLVYLQS